MGDLSQSLPYNPNSIHTPDVASPKEINIKAGDTTTTGSNTAGVDVNIEAGGGYRQSGPTVQGAGGDVNITGGAQLGSGGREGVINLNSVTILPTFALADLPSASNHPGGVVYVSDATPVSMAFSDSTNWISIITGIAVV